MQIGDLTLFTESTVMESLRLLAVWEAN